MVSKTPKGTDPVHVTEHITGRSSTSSFLLMPGQSRANVASLDASSSAQGHSVALLSARKTYENVARCSNSDSRSMSFLMVLIFAACSLASKILCACFINLGFGIKQRPKALEHLEAKQVTSEVPVSDIASPKRWRVLFQKWYASKSGVDATQGALFLTPSGVSPHLYVSGNQKWWWVWRELLIHLKFATPTTQV